MDNLGMIEEYTAMNGLGLPTPPGFTFPGVSDESYGPTEAGTAPIRNVTYQESYASPAPSIYSDYDFSFPMPWTPPPGSRPVIADSNPGGRYDDPASTSAAAAAKNIAANSQNVLAPQAGTVGIAARKLSIPDVINALLGVTAAGVTEVQRQKLAATLLTAQKKNQPVYLPPQIVQQSQTPWGLLAGAGALVAVGVALYFVLRKKS